MKIEKALENTSGAILPDVPAKYASTLVNDGVLYWWPMEGGAKIGPVSPSDMTRLDWEALSFPE